MSFPIALPNVREVGFLEVGAEYYFVLQFTQDVSEQNQRPRRVAFVATLPQELRACKS